MVIANFAKGEITKRVFGVWQYDYGQVLCIQGLTLPPAVEVDFSLGENGVDSIPLVGITKDGVTEVPIPDSLLKNDGAAMDYNIYAYIFVSDEASGQTEHEIVIYVKSRTKPGTPVEPGEPEPHPMSEIMEAINKIAAGKADKLAYEGDILKLLSGEKELSRVTIQGGGGGADAREIELRKSETAIQWHYAGEDTWKDLIQLSEITGKTGKNGITPHVGENGNWYIGDTDTGQKAAGEDGATPEIGQDGNWYINGQDTGKPSRGEKGDKGEQGEQGLPGKDGAPGANATDEQVQQAVDAYMQGVDLDAKLAGKLDKQQGVENAGKVLVVGEDGNVVPGETWGGGSEKQIELIESYAIEQSDTGFEIPIGSEYKDVLVEIKIKPKETSALRMKFDNQDVLFVTTGSYLSASTSLQLFMHNYGGYIDGWLKKISYETQISTNNFNSMKIKGMPNTITLTPWKSPNEIGVEAATAYVYAR